MGFKASPMFRDLLVFNWKAVVASLELPCFYHDQKCVLDQKQPEKKNRDPLFIPLLILCLANISRDHLIGRK